MSNIPPEECVLSHGVLGGAYVTTHNDNEDNRVAIAEQDLRDRLTRNLLNLPVAFKIWREREDVRGPAEEFLGRQWTIKFAVKPDHQVKPIIDSLPDDLGGVPLYCAPWTDALPNI
jgi:hypothetical protein